MLWYVICWVTILESDVVSIRTAEPGLLLITFVIASKKSRKPGSFLG